MAMSLSIILSSFTVILMLCSSSQSHGDAVPCTAEETCYNTTDWRCMQAPTGAKGAACTLDYGYNATGECVCSNAATCVKGSYPSATPGKKQYLVIGDSVSMGYVGSLKKDLMSEWDVVHAPGNCDNTNWGSRCLQGWLGSDRNRWDVISFNWGLHDLAFPDNEHLSVDTYSTLLASNIVQLKQSCPKAKLLWVTTTPVPTNPPNNPTTGKSCVLIPGRLESNVLLYNNAASKVVGSGVGVCDVHATITNYCGVGYASCNITQCAGPHFSSTGFAMLGAAVGKCVEKIATII